MIKKGNTGQTSRASKSRVINSVISYISIITEEGDPQNRLIHSINKIKMLELGIKWSKTGV